MNYHIKSKDPTGHMGEEISNQKKESIYNFIRDIEKQISGIKIHIGTE